MDDNLSDVAAFFEQVATGLELARDGALQDAVAVAMVQRGEGALSESFAGQTAPNGTPWAKAARNYGHPLLHDSGDLADSGLVEIGPRNDATGLDITFRYTDGKAAWQHFGTARGIPPRHLLPAVGEAGLWRMKLEAAGQVACDTWLTEHVRL